jgi:parvulin-like peptidyl-prolyl isomerase
MNCTRSFFVIVILGLVATNVLAQDASKLIVTVDDTKITDGDLQFLYLSRRVPKDRQAAVRERFIGHLIERALLKQYLTGKVKVSDELIDRYVARIAGLVKREGRKIDEVLKAMGYTKETFRAEIAGPLAWDRHARFAIPETAIEKFWEANRSKYDGTEVVAAQIVKRVPKAATPEDLMTLKSKLSDLRQSIAAGDISFEDAAKKHSDSPTAKKGGSLGTFPFSGRMPQEISGVAFKLKAGEISEPFQTRFGMHLLTVSKIEPGILSLEDARKEIIEHLSNEMRTQLVASLRDKAKIQYAK